MKPGPKPKPTELKIAAGNPGKRPLNENEPDPELEIPECPKHLDKIAKEEWELVGKQLEELGVIAEVDSLALELLCDAYSRYRRLRDEFEKDPKFVVVMSTGVSAQNPKLKVLREEIKIIRDFLQQFGMSPSSRTGIKTNKKSSKLDKFLNRAK